MATKETEPTSPEIKSDKTGKPSKKRKTEIEEIAVDLTLPEPPSKKAKRLLKKGKSLPVKPKSEDEASENDDETKTEAAKAGAKKKEKKERSPYGIWIGNLRFTVTKQELRQWFIENSGGAITDDLITRVHLPTSKTAAVAGPGPKKPFENRGFAYVDFATFEANVAAIALSETEWYRRKVLIKDAKSFEGRPKKEEPAPVDNTDGAAANRATANGRNTAASTNTKIFVGNLSFAVTEDDLREHFAKCGPIRWIKVATFEDTGKCKGYGWVNFEEPEAAQWAVKGFVKVRETVDTLEDFMDVDEKEEEKKDEETKEEEKEESSSSSESDSNSDDSDSNEDEESDNKKKKTEQVEEKKGPSPVKKTAPKEAPRIKTRKWWVNQLHGRTLKIELAEDDQTRYQKRFKGKGAAARKEAQQGGEGGITEVLREKKEYQKKPSGPSGPSYSTDINVARLTGAAVAPQGKRTTF